jgi:nucleoside-diphosphate-sugar epimerase
LKVLLTGASGFVGSHILDRLRADGVATALLLRPSSDRRWLEPHLPSVEVRPGSISDPASLRAALTSITHVIHCAGCTRARSPAEFDEVNHIGTRNVVEAVNAQAGGVRRLLHVSSLAVTGPATPAQPAREDDAPHPISDYGKSKLAGEMEVRSGCRGEYVILRPPAVYGPRDYAFLSMFKAVNHHLLPRPSKTQGLSLVYVKDLAEAIVTCLDHPAAGGKTYFVAAREVVTGRQMAEQIAAQINRWTVPCPLPAALLWPVCQFQEMLSHLTGKPALLNRQKFAELSAPGWVCDPSRLQREVGYECRTALKQGIAETLSWYRQEHWL